MRLLFICVIHNWPFQDYFTFFVYKFLQAKFIFYVTVIIDGTDAAQSHEGQPSASYLIN